MQYHGKSINEIYIASHLWYWVQDFNLILDSSVSLSVDIQSAGDSVPVTLARILHSAQEDDLSPFDSKIACLCQSIEINNNHVCAYVWIYEWMHIYIYIYICVCVCVVSCTNWYLTNNPTWETLMRVNNPSVVLANVWHFDIISIYL